MSYIKSPSEELANLKRRLQELDTHYKKEFSLLSEQITVLQSLLNSSSEVEVSQKDTSGVSIIPALTTIISNEITTDAPKVNTPQKAVSKTPVFEPIVRSKKTPSLVSNFLVVLKEFLVPFFTGVDLLTSVYKKYKSEQKLPIFFMTLAGVLAILFGAGFLLQYSLQYLGVYQVLFKIILGTLIAGGAIILGIKLYHKSSAYREYAASLMGLGVLVNYLMLYFLADLGNFPILSSVLFGFGLVVGNTFLSLFLALRYESKIVTVLSLLGGVLTPVFINAFENGNFYYFYLWLLSIASLYLAKKINWNLLIYIVFVSITVAVEYLVFVSTPNTLLFAVYSHLFAYTFFYVLSVEGKRFKALATSLDLVVFTGVLSVFVYNLYSCYLPDLVAYGVVLAGNATVFAAVLFIFKKTITNTVKAIFYAATAVLFAAAILVLFAKSWAVILWSIEGLLLLFLGFKFSFTMLRKEAYVLVAISFVSLFLYTFNIVFNWYALSWIEGFVHLITIGFILIGIDYLVKKHRSSLLVFEIEMGNLIREILPLWAVLVYSCLTFQYLGKWGTHFAVVPLFLLFYWQKIKKTQHTYLLAGLHLVGMLFVLCYSYLLSGSYHFSEQNLQIKILTIEVLASLWGLSYFFDAIGIQKQKQLVFAHKLRELFFVVLPLLCSSSIAYYFPNFTAFGLCLATLCAYLLLRKLSYRSLKIEFYVLTVISTSYSILQLDTLGLGTSLVFFTVFVFFENAHETDSYNSSSFKDYLRKIVVLFPFLIGFFVVSFVEHLVSFAIFMAVFSMFLLLYFEKNMAFVRDSSNKLRVLAVVAQTLGFVILVFSPSEWIFVVALCTSLMLTFLLFHSRYWFESLEVRLWNTFAVLNQLHYSFLFLLFLGYLSVDSFGAVVSVLFALHAIVLLFVAVKKNIRVFNTVSIVLFSITLLKVVLHDIRDFVLIEKIAVLLLLGILLLGASFGYVKLTQKYKAVKVRTHKEQ